MSAREPIGSQRDPPAQRLLESELSSGTLRARDCQDKHVAARHVENGFLRPRRHEHDWSEQGYRKTRLDHGYLPAID